MDIALTGNQVALGSLLMVLSIVVVINYLKFRYRKSAQGDVGAKHAKASKHSIELDGRTK